jgi:hypothetical protein
LEFELALSNTVDNLLRRDADIAVRMVEPAQEALVVKKLHAHKDYLARTCTPTGFSDLVEHSLIGFDRETPAIRGMRSRVPGADALRFSFRADSDIAQLRAIKAGFGIGICQVGLAKQNPDLVRLLPEAFELKLGVWLAMHENLRATPPLPRCIRWLGGQPCRIFEPVSGERRANSKPRQRLHRRMPYQNFMILERGENAKSQSIAAMSVFCPKTSTVAIGSDPFYVDPGRVRHVAFAQKAVIPRRCARAGQNRSKPKGQK